MRILTFLFEKTVPWVKTSALTKKKIISITHKHNNTNTEAYSYNKARHSEQEQPGNKQSEVSLYMIS